MINKHIIMTLIVISVNAWTLKALAEGSEPAAKSEHAAPEEAHGGSKAEAGKAAKGHEPEHGKAGVQLPLTASQHYVQSWINFPPVFGRSLQNGEKIEFPPRPGRALVVAFLASWCVPCQQMMPELQKLEAKYRDRYTDFVYIFAHDTVADARGFGEHFKLGPQAIIGSAALLEGFHQPELPSLYIADRSNWLVDRRLNTKLSDLKAIDSYLEIHTAN